jgi:hypothetical protein
MAGNATPHFVKGITGGQCPTVFGDSPMTNVLAGWSGLVVAGALAQHARSGRHAGIAVLAGATGVLLAGVYHAHRGPTWLNNRIGR